MASTGAVQYALWSPDGWGTTYSVGKVISGERGLDARARGRRSIGGQESLVGGLMVPRLVFEYMPETAALLTYAKRASYPAGALAEMAFEAGTDAEGLRLYAAKCNQWDLELAVDEALRLKMDWWSAAATEATSGGSMAAVGAPTFEWYSGSVTAGGVSYAARRIRVTMKNNLKPVASLDVKAAGQRRYPDAMVEGYEEVTVVADYLADPGHAIGGDELPAGTIQLVAANGAETLTVTAADAVPVRWSQAFEVDDLILWRVEYRLPANSGDLTIAVA
jgi:hypothetical protein